MILSFALGLSLLFSYMSNVLRASLKKIQNCLRMFQNDMAAIFCLK